MNMELRPSMLISWMTLPGLSVPSSILFTILSPMNSFGFGIRGLINIKYISGYLLLSTNFTDQVPINSSNL